MPQTPPKQEAAWLVGTRDFESWSAFGPCLRRLSNLLRGSWTSVFSNYQTAAPGTGPFCLQPNALLARPALAIRAMPRQHLPRELASEPGWATYQRYWRRVRKRVLYRTNGTYVHVRTYTCTSCIRSCTRLSRTHGTLKTHINNINPNINTSCQATGSRWTPTASYSHNITRSCETILLDFYWKVGCEFTTAQEEMRAVGKRAKARRKCDNGLPAAHRELPRVEVGFVAFCLCGGLCWFCGVSE
jgi:hypothetical protein